MKEVSVSFRLFHCLNCYGMYVYDVHTLHVHTCSIVRVHVSKICLKYTLARGGDITCAFTYIITYIHTCTSAYICTCVGGLLSSSVLTFASLILKLHRIVLLTPGELLSQHFELL